MTIFCNFYQLDYSVTGDRVYLAPNPIIPEDISIFLSYILAKVGNHVLSAHSNISLENKV